MTQFRESEHPRARDGKFSVKEIGEADGVTLADVDTFEMLHCEACGGLCDTSEGDLLYECGTCNGVSSERRCDQCNLFKARSEEVGCPDCGEPLNTDPVECVVDHDGALIRFEDYDPEGAPLEERSAQARAAAEAAREAEAAEAAAERKGLATPVRAADVEVGQVLIDPSDTGRFPSEPTVLAVREVDTPDGPIVVLTVDDFGFRTVVRRAGDTLHFKAGATFGDAPNYEPMRFVPECNEKMKYVSSTSPAIDVEVGHASRAGGTLPRIALVAGRRYDGKIQGHVHTIATWDDPQMAAASLEAMEQAADALEEAQAGTEYVRAADPEAVAVTTSDWVNSDFREDTTLEVGISAWESDAGPLVSVRGGSGLNTAFNDPHVLRAAAAQVRAHLHTLTGVPLKADVVDDRL